MRILRDSWGWRGGFAADEIDYRPRLADAVRGPIEEPAERHWPCLVSAADVGALLGRSGSDPASGMAAAVAHVLLVQRTGGYHAVLPARMPEVARAHADVCGPEGLPDLDAALGLLEGIGAIERTASRIATVRPPAPAAEDLLRLRSALDVIDSDTSRPVASLGFARLAWRTVREGIAAQRYRELARAGRLRAVVAPPSGAAADPDALYTVGPMTLPSLVHVLSTEQDAPHASRGWISARRIAFETADGGVEARPAGADGRPLPVLVAAHEMAARLLGEGVGSNAMRRAVRASGMWLVLLAHTDGRAGTFDTSVAALASEFAPLYGLDAQGDNRAYASLLLGDLERIGAVSLGRPTRKTLRVDVHRPDPPEDRTLRHFLGQWAVWRAAGDGDPQGAIADSLTAARTHLHARVRAPWIELLETRRLRVEVGAGRP